MFLSFFFKPVQKTQILVNLQKWCMMSEFLESKLIFVVVVGLEQEKNKNKIPQTVTAIVAQRSIKLDK